MANNDVEASVDSLTDWWETAGCTVAVSDTPVNWLRPVAPVPTLHSVDPASFKGSNTAISCWPDTLDAFHGWLATDPMLPELAWPQLSGEQKRVLPSGPARPSLMVICDAPDPQDMTDGTLLSGDIGRLFHAMIAAIGSARTDLYISSLALARPAGGIIGESDMTQLAIRMRHHIALVGPRRVLLLGDKTSRALLPTVDETNTIGLRPLNHEGGTLDAIAVPHPRFLLKQPSAKMGCWRQLQLLIEAQPV